MQTPQSLQGKYTLDVSKGLIGKSIIVWDGQHQAGRTFQLASGNWVVESSHHTETVFKNVSDAIDRITIDWEGCRLESGRLGEWVIDRMAQARR